jgi:hypothetical protein
MGIISMPDESSHLAYLHVDRHTIRKTSGIKLSDRLHPR